ncbi:hypothetical protein [Streptomyces sp. AP-93]|uniref:hypothetical protein n=1 Tax=Streptomyces sp. AP-93 TaxID=2929048 RepID=UPI001FAFE876|nr:hypothetical protein [Streptomyces sp. AP-93]MCJ0875457.1 hypothetical protein [Streptomyces sp. AP-93]
MEHDQPDAEAWSDALKLYTWLCTFVAVSPREHDEWWVDVGAIMRLETQDPRGWESIDPYEGEEERIEDPLFPWLETPSSPEDAERYRRLVDEIPRSSVRSLIVRLGAGSDRRDLSSVPGWEDSRQEMERRADVILSRFPGTTRFYTNLVWKPAQPDFYEQPVRGHAPFSQYDWDAGLIAVNDEEVAVLWNFLST